MSEAARQKLLEEYAFEIEEMRKAAARHFFGLAREHQIRAAAYQRGAWLVGQTMDPPPGVIR